MWRRWWKGVGAGALGMVLSAGAWGGIPGDVNEDGQVDAQDIQLVINVVLGRSIAPYDEANADITGSGDVNAEDIQIVINIVLGLDVDLPDNGDEPVDMDPPPDERMALIDEAGEYFGSLDVRELGVDEKNQQMVQWLDAHEAFSDPGVSADEVVYAFFADGTPHLFVDNFLTDGEGDNQGAGEGGKRQTGPFHMETAVRAPTKDNDAPPDLEPPEPDTLGTERPESRKAEVLNVFHGELALVDGMEEVQERLEEIGYEMGPLTTAEDPSIREYMEMEDLGVLVMAGHGGKATPEDQEFGFIQTNAVPTEAEMEEFHESDVETYRMVTMSSSVGEEDGEVVTDKRWAITSLFVEEYFEFAPRAVVFTLACNSFNETFIEAFLGKGAGAFLAWDDTIGDWQGAPRMTHFFSRVLGAEEPTADWDTAPVRAFDFTATLREMDRHDLGAVTDERNQGSTLRLQKAEDEWPSILAPSIRNIRIDPIAGELYLHGLFGEEPEDLNTADTHVMVDFEMLDILEWDEWVITCELPSSGPGSKGPVWLSAGGILSNIVMLTEYTGTAEMEDGLAEFRFRMPVQPFHIKPDTEPYTYLDLEEVAESLQESAEIRRLLARYEELGTALAIGLPSAETKLDIDRHLPPVPITGYWEEDSSITIGSAAPLSPEMERFPAPEQLLTAPLPVMLQAMTPPVVIGGASLYAIDNGGDGTLGMMLSVGGIVNPNDDEETAGGTVPPWEAMMDPDDYSVPGGTWQSNGGMTFIWSTLEPEFPPEY